MTQEQTSPGGPDLTRGVSPAEWIEDKLLGHVGDQEILLVRVGAEILAVDAHCTHYHGPLADGIVVDGSIRCPWHHACFDLRTGEATRAPAFSPLSCWRVEQRDGTIFVQEKLEPKTQPKPSAKTAKE